jgi:hypothetical protein
MPAIEVESLSGQRPLRNWSVGQFLNDFFTPAYAPSQRLASRFGGISEWTLQVAERFMFPGLWLIITGVSTIDMYLTVRYRDDLFYGELNPMARLLLQIDNWDPSLLIGAKFLGSVLVLAFLMLLYQQNRRVGLIVSGALASFQLVLLMFLASA